MEISFQVGEEFKRQFKRLAKKYRSLNEDLRAWKIEMLENPLMGSDLGSGVRKVRMSIASKGKGKSGSARILTLHVLVKENGMKITLLTIYDKGEISSVTEEYIKYLIQQIP